MESTRKQGEDDETQVQDLQLALARELMGTRATSSFATEINAELDQANTTGVCLTTQNLDLTSALDRAKAEL